MNTTDWVHDHPDDPRKTGKMNRTSSGRYQGWRTERPSKEALEQAKQELLDVKHPKFFFEATCGCCKMKYALPTVYAAVKKTGACTYCDQFMRGLATGYIVEREPTLEEALAAPINDIRSADIWVMRKTLLAQQGGG